MNRITSFQGEHRWLSNFWPSEIMVGFENKGFRSVPTVEHAYQSMKATNVLDFNFVCDSSTPGMAKKGGRMIAVREDFDSIKVGIMLDLLRQKFQHPDLRQKLLETGDAELVEGNTWGDTFWGVCNGVGKNNLGKLLMTVRAELKS